MGLIRTFHPVGQGAFYSEIHSFDGGKFTIVYDCGSTTLNEEQLEKKIKSTFPKEHQIDILFISHFHADHINGIKTLKKHCKIKTVVLPLLDPNAKTLVKVANKIDSNYSETGLIDAPDVFFGEKIPIITIGPVPKKEEEDSPGEGPIEYISSITSKRCKSGTIFQPEEKINWLFIPFNYEQDERKTQFESALKKHELTLDDIATIDDIQKNKDKIVEAYKDVDGDLNKNSMALFSGKKETETINCFQHHCCRLCHHFGLRFTVESGCLYMGDIDLTSPDIANNLKNKLKSVISRIGTLQVPHHGSVHNFDKTILDENDEIRCAIFSYGTTNTYGHPSDKVISEVIANKAYPYLITEEQHSMVTQWN
jgi:beta-lactamase superfamily II metal-dependent hydrolase